MIALFVSSVWSQSKWFLHPHACFQLQVTLKQTKAACGSSFDKMDSNDLCVTSGVKIEIDVAEEPPIFWGTVKDHQGQGEAVVMLIPVYT